MIVVMIVLMIVVMMVTVMMMLAQLISCSAKNECNAGEARTGSCEIQGISIHNPKPQSQSTIPISINNSISNYWFTIHISIHNLNNSRLPIRFTIHDPD